MEREQADLGKLCRRGYSSCDGVWDIVKLKIEKYPKAETREHPNDSRAFGGEELTAYLEQSGCTSELTC